VVDVRYGQHGKSGFPAQNMWLVLHVYGQFLTGAEMIHAVVVQAVYNVLGGLSSGRSVGLDGMQLVMRRQSRL